VAAIPVETRRVPNIDEQYVIKYLVTIYFSFLCFSKFLKQFAPRYKHDKMTMAPGRSGYWVQYLLSCQALGRYREMGKHDNTVKRQGFDGNRCLSPLLLCAKSSHLTKPPINLAGFLPHQVSTVWMSPITFDKNYTSLQIPCALMRCQILH
jgi:hypothetical protein